MAMIGNNSLSNTEVVFSFGKVKFNEAGLALIDNEEHVKLALGVDGFYPVKDVKEESPVQEDTPEPKKASTDMTHAELDALATELNIKGYNIKGKKEDKVKAINGTPE